MLIAAHLSCLHQVHDKKPEEVRATIESVAAEAVDEILQGNGLRYTLAQRGTAGQTAQYVEELDRNYLEYRKMMREFADASQVKKTTMMTRLMQVPTLVPASARGRDCVFLSSGVGEAGGNSADISRFAPQLVREMCVKGIHSTKRDLFYADVKLFEKQNNSDGILEELAVMFGCTRQVRTSWPTWLPDTLSPSLTSF